LMRLFVGEPVWTPYNRPQEDHPARVLLKELNGALQASFYNIDECADPNVCKRTERTHRKVIFVLVVDIRMMEKRMAVVVLLPTLSFHGSKFL
ncbi:hypothetical protein HAX54_017252, partial [Datura stramonium]|nr:hypothetical protein [Datura stramonium]